MIGAECARAKPHADPYLEGMKRIGKTPEQCVVFEDSRSGIAAGKAAGVAAIVGIRSSLDDATIRGHGANASMEDWRELTPQMLASLLNGKEVSKAPVTWTADSLGNAALLLDIDGTLVSSVAKNNGKNILQVYQ